MWIQKNIQLNAQSRGFHIITDELISGVPEIKDIGIGLLHVFIKHTSASLTINENADPSVRSDLENHFNKYVPENADYYQHVDEGSDDMPAHIKSCLLGSSLSIPITQGRLNMGVWQGIYLCEHRNQAASRRLVVTIQGEPSTIEK